MSKHQLMASLGANQIVDISKIASAPASEGGRSSARSTQSSSQSEPMVSLG
jgi:hypothetical protein